MANCRLQVIWRRLCFLSEGNPSRTSIRGKCNDIHLLFFYVSLSLSLVSLSFHVRCLGSWVQGRVLDKTFGYVEHNQQMSWQLCMLEDNTGIDIFFIAIVTKNFFGLSFSPHLLVFELSWNEELPKWLSRTSMSEILCKLSISWNCPLTTNFVVWLNIE